jgi:hypothetical protein
MSTPPSLTPSDRGRFLTFALLFILSGMGGLMYQVVWARKLQLTFGVSIFAIASVLAAYFLGMALKPRVVTHAPRSILRLWRSLQAWK